MPDSPSPKPDPQDNLSERIRMQVARKQRAQQRTTQGIWFGMGTMGLVGWSVAVPTLLGAALGIWLDAHYPGSHAWTLSLLVAGLCLGCANAWHWVAKEEKAIHQNQENHDE